MPDLITHIASAFLWKAATRRPHVGLLAVAVVIPDLTARVPAMSMMILAASGVPVPEALMHFPQVCHMPLGMVLVATLAALCFGAEQRLLVWRHLVGGAALHLALDVTQDHLGVGYLLAFPLSGAQWELGWLGTEDTVLIAPPLLLAAALLWRWRRPRPARPVI